MSRVTDFIGLDQETLKKKARALYEAGVSGQLEIESAGDKIRYRNSESIWRAFERVCRDLGIGSRSTVYSPTTLSKEDFEDVINSL